MRGESRIAPHTNEPLGYGRGHVSARAIVFTILLLIAAIYINFAPYLAAVQAEQIYYCDTEFAFGTEHDQCAFIERPLRHLPESMFQKPADVFEGWYEVGAELIDWFGMPGNPPGDYFAAWQKWSLWVGIYSSCLIVVVLVVVGAYIAAVTSRPDDTRAALDRSDWPAE
jgi:hypothetical protein